MAFNGVIKLEIGGMCYLSKAFSLTKNSSFGKVLVSFHVTAMTVVAVTFLVQLLILISHRDLRFNSLSMILDGTFSRFKSLHSL